MTLTTEKIGQIAVLALQSKMEESGLNLNPKTIKREIANEAKKLGIPAHELAEFAKIMLKSAFDKTMAELDSIKAPQDEK
jgi:hypothetical protein